MGLYMNQKGVKSVFLIGPNYAAGKDMLAGLKSTFKGEVMGEEYTVWPSQLDFSAELPKARNSKAKSIFVFIRGPLASSPQSICAGRHQGADAALYGFHHRRIVAAAAEGQCGRRSRRAGMGQRSAERAEQEVLEDYRKKYPGLRPTYYGAQAYDAAQLINSAVVAVKGDTGKKDAMKAEMEKADFRSLRGPFKYGNNHIPVQNFYLQNVMKDADGTLSLKTIATIVKDDQDRFHDKCPMK